MTMDEIVRALRCISTPDITHLCNGCKYRKSSGYDADEVNKDAIRLIECLTAENAALREKVPQWINVEDRLPEDRGDVLVVAYWHEIWGVHLGWCAPERGAWSVHVGFADRSDLNVTYWMPLPEAPEEAPNGNL